MPSVVQPETELRRGELIGKADRAKEEMLAGLAQMPPQALVYLREVDAVDPLAAIATVRLRTLLIQGGRDQSVTPEQVDALAAARGALPTEIARFPELQHFYKRAAPGLDAMASFALSTNNDPAVKLKVCPPIMEETYAKVLEILESRGYDLEDASLPRRE